jgi:hypothetical protein
MDAGVYASTDASVKKVQDALQKGVIGWILVGLVFMEADLFDETVCPSNASLR